MARLRIDEPDRLDVRLAAGTRVAGPVGLATGDLRGGGATGAVAMT